MLPAHGDNFQVSPPEKFDCGDGKKWPRWNKRFERYRVASGLDKKGDAFQVNTLMYFMGEDAEDILDASPLTLDQKQNYAAVIKSFSDYFVGRHNVIFERAQFNVRKQEPGESADSFITSIHKLAEHCNFGVLREELIRDRIVVGIRNIALSEKLQIDADLTLQKAISQVKQSEVVKQQQAVMRGESPQAEERREVDAISRAFRRQEMQGHKQHGQVRSRQTETVSSSERCQKCGRGPHNWKECPANNAECRKCRKRGHFAAVCRSMQPVHEVQDELQQDTLFMGEYPPSP
nr:uncharacterized protein LOC133572629 [Nerophis lumbriciformis]